MTVASVRQNILLLAEAFDAWRVIPRLMILAYGYLVFNLYIWYKNIPTYVEEKCDSTVLKTLLEQGMDPEKIKAFACTVVDVVGGPTAAQSTFVTTIIGLSTGIFGLYTATGRKWEGWEPNFITKNGQVVQYMPAQPTTQVVTATTQVDGSVTLQPADQQPKTNIQIFANQNGQSGATGTEAPTTTPPAPAAETVVTAPDIEPETEVPADAPKP